MDTFKTASKEEFSYQNNYIPGSIHPTRVPMTGIKKKALNPYITCYLCNGYFRDAHTINECNHTFCKSCIYKYFHENPLKEACPKCNTHLGGKPLEYLMADTHIQHIVDTLFPEFRKLDIDCIKTMYEHFQKGEPLPEDKNLLRAIDPQQNDYKYGKTRELDLRVKLSPFPSENAYLRLPPLLKQSVQTSNKITVLQIKKYLCAQIESSNNDHKNIDILCKNQILPDNHSLEYIVKCIWQEKRTLELNYQKNAKKLQV